MSRELIGPALPPGFKARDRDPNEASQVSGPALPPGFITYHSSSDDSDEGGLLHRAREDLDGEHSPCPKRRKQEAVEQEEEDDDDDDGFFGPALPPGFINDSNSPQRNVIGPALPPGFVKQSEDSDGEVGHTGNTSESESSSSEDEDGDIGPKPAKGPIKYAVVQDFERRARKMKEKLTSGGDESNQVARESWMTELPPELTNFGLGPRTFKRRTNEKSGDRSIWTDTPADREKKAKEKQEGKVSTTKAEEVPLSHRDQRLAEQVSTYNESKRAESLIDIHRKKLKQKAKEDQHKPQERRPFDRDQDLHVNRFDDAQKKALLNKSRELNTKFSHGKSNMFL